MKIFNGTTAGVDLFDQKFLRVGLKNIPVDGAALKTLVKGVLKRGSISGSADNFSIGVEGGSSNIAYSDDAALVVFDTSVMAAEDATIRAIDGKCRALLGESVAYFASAPYSAAAAVYNRYQGLLIMEPGSVLELREGYRRLPLLDWIDRKRGIHKGYTRYELAVRVSYDGTTVKIEKQPEQSQIIQ